MSLNYQTEAIILISRDTGNTDKMLTLFSKEYGKITVMAYGVRNSKKRQSGYLQPFTHLDISLAKSKFVQGIDTADQWQVLTSFRKLREDLSMMAYGNFLCELVNELWLEREADNRVFELVLQVFELMSDRNPRIAALMGAFKLISLAGLRPNYDNCIYCGNIVVTDAYFDFSAGGTICLDCQKSRPAGAARILTKPVFDFLVLMEKISLTAPGNFSINAKTLSQAEALIFGHIDYSLERPLKSAPFIEKVNALMV